MKGRGTYYDSIWMTLKAREKAAKRVTLGEWDESDCSRVTVRNDSVTRYRHKEVEKERSFFSSPPKLTSINRNMKTRKVRNSG